MTLDSYDNRLQIASLENLSQLSNDKLSKSPIVKCIESFIVTGFSVRTQNKDEFNEKTSKLSNLWQQFSTSELATNANIFGVYSNYDSDANGFYTVTAGVKGDHAKTELRAATVQAGHYLVFEATGSMPSIVVQTWKRVWEFFETNTEYNRNFISDFEKYSGTDHVEIYIGLK